MVVGVILVIIVVISLVVGVGFAIVDGVMYTSDPVKDYKDKAKYLNIVEDFNDEMNLSMFEYRGHYYCISNEKLSIEDAKNRCEIFGGHLFTINSEEEQIFAIRALDFLEDRDDYIILGIDSRADGGPAWITDEPMDFTFADFDITKFSDKAVAYKRSKYSRWTQVDSNQKYCYICEFDRYEDIGNSPHEHEQIRWVSTEQEFYDAINQEVLQIELNNDITLNQQINISFTGHLNGNGHTINVGNARLPLFGYKNALSTYIYNLAIEADDRRCTNGLLYTENYGTIRDVSLKGKVSFSSDTAGGFCYMNEGTIDKCSSFLEAEGNYDVSGICDCNFGVVSNSIHAGKINSGRQAAGICISTHKIRDKENFYNNRNIGSVYGSYDWRDICFYNGYL